MGTRDRGTAEKIAAAAGKLFFEEGVEAIRVDRVAAIACVTKRTLYRHFASRDLLVAATVKRPSPLRPETSDEPPLTQIDRMFQRLTDYVSAPGFRGCPYANAATALPNVRHPARAAIKTVKEQRRTWFQERLKEAGIARHEVLADELSLIFDGALVASNVRMS